MGTWNKVKRAFVRSDAEQAVVDARKEDERRYKEELRDVERKAYREEKLKQAKEKGRSKATRGKRFREKIADFGKSTVQEHGRRARKTRNVFDFDGGMTFGPPTKEKMKDLFSFDLEPKPRKKKSKKRKGKKKIIVYV